MVVETAGLPLRRPTRLGFGAVGLPADVPARRAALGGRRLQPALQRGIHLALARRGRRRGGIPRRRANALLADGILDRLVGANALLHAAQEGAKTNAEHYADSFFAARRRRAIGMTLASSSTRSASSCVAFMFRPMALITSMLRPSPWPVAFWKSSA